MLRLLSTAYLSTSAPIAAEVLPTSTAKMLFLALVAFYIFDRQEISLCASLSPPSAYCAKSALRTLQIEQAAIGGLQAKLDENFDRACELILACQGRVWWSLAWVNLAI